MVRNLNWENRWFSSVFRCLKIVWNWYRFLVSCFVLKIPCLSVTRNFIAYRCIVRLFWIKNILENSWFYPISRWEIPSIFWLAKNFGMSYELKLKWNIIFKLQSWYTFNFVGIGLKTFKLWFFKVIQWHENREILICELPSIFSFPE